MNEAKRRFTSFNEFYPYYLTEHQHPTSRRLHFMGTLLVIVVFISALITGYYLLLIMLPVTGYGFAWIGHFFFEKNKPATFTYPLYSLLGDFRMFRDILMGKLDY